MFGAKKERLYLSDILENPAITYPTYYNINKALHEDEMFRAFNMGFGMILVVKNDDVDTVLANAEGSYLVGEIKEGEKKALLV